MNSSAESLSTCNVITAPQHALRVALQTMKERCFLLQQRLAILEKEKDSLKFKNNNDLVEYTNRSCQNNETFALHEKISELSNQNNQLNESNSMLVKENCQLWSYITEHFENEGRNQQTAEGSSCNQNFALSKNLTQHEPNLLLRQKLLPIKPYDDLTLQDVSLKILHNSVESSEKVKKDGATAAEKNTYGFSFLTDDTNDCDVNTEAKSCYNAIQDIKKELLQQQSVLKRTINNVLLKRDSKSYPINKSVRSKPEMIDKDVEVNFTSFKIPNNSIRKENNNSTGACSNDVYKNSFSFNTSEEKNLANSRNKICPLCGQEYASNILFEEFQKHVESHFIDEIEGDVALEKTFEIFSHSVGEF